ncbi:LOW QUALITY PROTEIN: heme oxygenase-like, partial [Osmerus mordax]
FKQLYRGRMNGIELTEEERTGVLGEAVLAFEFNIEVFDGLQKMLSETENDNNTLQRHATHSKLDNGVREVAKSLQIPASLNNAFPLFRMILGLCVALATVGMGIYVF